jgi:opacity protein-like surface antigen
MLKKVVFSGFGLFFSLAALASDAVLPDDLPPSYESIITLSGGAAWTTPGQNQYLYPQAFPSYQYYTFTSGTKAMVSGEIFFGLERVVSPYLIGQLGLGVGGVSDAMVSGYTNVDGTADAYSYTYKINHGRLELKGKLIAYTLQPIQPYISGSLGIAFNNAHEYIPVALNANVAAPLWFGTNVTPAFPYTFGAGVQAMLNANWQVAVGYQFADLGKSFLGGDGVVLGSGLRQTHFYTNEALVSISYLFS